MSAMSDLSVEKPIQVNTKINQKELYEFIMHHNYASVRGVISVLFSLICLIGTIFYWEQFSMVQKILMAFMSMMFTVVTPVEYYIRAARQIKKNFKEEIHYTFDGNGIIIRIKDQSSSLPWNEVMKVISTGKLVIIYFTPIRALIIPKREIGEQFETLKALMEEHTDCYRFKMVR